MIAAYAIEDANELSLADNEKGQCGTENRNKVDIGGELATAIYVARQSLAP